MSCQFCIIMRLGLCLPGPRTIILTKVGKLVPCSPLLKPLYFFSDSWYSQEGYGLVKSFSPQELKDDPIEYHFEPLQGLAESGLVVSRFFFFFLFLTPRSH
uniref:Uncharacterized protein n=1 Tax=Cacopsylla melanoneura TaxID=428564 RepID=A0A8D8TDJ2_9HEMI